MKKKLVLCVALVFLMSSATVFAEIGYSFEHEPNDTMEDACNTPVLNDYDNIRIAGTANSNDKVDWYEIWSVETLGEVKFKLQMDDFVDYDIYIYNQDGNFISSSTIREKGKIERIRNILIRPEQPLYAKIVYVSGEPIEPYDLLVKLYPLYESNLKSNAIKQLEKSDTNIIDRSLLK
ncbi:hypothetical protein [Clostridiisalibacter paucivorans]|uniref:hypothetical protein n=1 Tax=Clostridiisalibacter paucivorans TaxID=408753 RepID=UPI000478F4A8|nr:hypothetical protein [Clostridiisalibacter paucivorans]